MTFALVPAVIVGLIVYLAGLALIWVVVVALVVFVLFAAWHPWRRSL